MDEWENEIIKEIFFLKKLRDRRFRIGERR